MAQAIYFCSARAPNGRAHPEMAGISWCLAGSCLRFKEGWRWSATSLSTFSVFCYMLQEVNFDSARGGVSVITEKDDVTTSYLYIQRAKDSDTGHYRCSPSNANNVTVKVHVLGGEFCVSFACFSVI